MRPWRCKNSPHSSWFPDEDADAEGEGEGEGDAEAEAEGEAEAEAEAEAVPSKPMVMPSELTKGKTGEKIEVCGLGWCLECGVVWCGAMRCDVKCYPAGG